MVRFFSLMLVFVAAVVLAASISAFDDGKDDGGKCSASAATCSQSPCSAGKCTASKCTEGACTESKCTEGKCTASKCTEGKCTEEAKCCGTCSGDEAKCTAGTCTKGTCTEGKCAEGEAKCCGTCSGDKAKCTAGTCTEGEAKCCGTCSGDKSKCTAGTCTEGTCTEGKCAEGEAKCCGTCGGDESKCTAGTCSEGSCSDGKCGSIDGTCGEACSSHKDTAAKDCPVTTAMKNLPRVMYVVGEEKTGCHCTASEVAKKTGAKMIYVVAGKAFECPNEAKTALVNATETFVAKYTEPQTCKESGTCSIAGKKSCCPNMAAATSKMLKTAMGKVKMSYVVGDKECGCPVAAKQLAKDSGKATEFVVAGVKSNCKVTARLNLARAKYKAAVEALVKAETKAPASDDS